MIATNHIIQPGKSEEIEHQYAIARQIGRQRRQVVVRACEASYLRWKLRCLMARKKRKVKRPMMARWRQVTSSK